MSQKKKLTTNAGAPAVRQPNILTAGTQKPYKTEAETKGEPR